MHRFGQPGYTWIALPARSTATPSSLAPRLLAPEERSFVRVGKDGYDDALELPGARPMDFTGRPLKGFVFVGKRGYVKDDELKQWVNRGVHHARSLPAK